MFQCLCFKVNIDVLSKPFQVFFWSIIFFHVTLWLFSIMAILAPVKNLFAF